MPKNIKNIAIIGAIVIAAFVVYVLFFVHKEEPVLSGTPTTASTAVDQDLVAILFELKAITLNDDIFSNPVFRSLVDFGQELVPEPVGRVNPFAPLGQ